MADILEIQDEQLIGPVYRFVLRLQDGKRDQQWALLLYVDAGLGEVQLLSAEKTE
jgi:hypothetical protein